jgi:hypothetical protein
MCYPDTASAPALVLQNQALRIKELILSFYSEVEYNKLAIIVPNVHFCIRAWSNFSLVNFIL